MVHMSKAEEGLTWQGPTHDPAVSVLFLETCKQTEIFQLEGFPNESYAP